MIFINRKLPIWMQSLIPNMFYIEEKSYNYYPYTITEYTVILNELYFLIVL